MKNAEGLEPGSTRELQGGYHFTLYKVKLGAKVESVRWVMRPPPYTLMKTSRKHAVPASFRQQRAYR